MAALGSSEGIKALAWAFANSVIFPLARCTLAAISSDKSTQAGGKPTAAVPLLQQEKTAIIRRGMFLATNQSHPIPGLINGANLSTSRCTRAKSIMEKDLLGLSKEEVDSSITGPPPPPELDGDEPAGTLTLFKASLYLLYKIVLFLVAISKWIKKISTESTRSIKIKLGKGSMSDEMGTDSIGLLGFKRSGKCDQDNGKRAGLNFGLIFLVINSSRVAESSNGWWRVGGDFPVSLIIVTTGTPCPVVEHGYARENDVTQGCCSIFSAEFLGRFCTLLGQSFEEGDA
ncbi:long-chain-fatty-acid CoA ligase [Striga asiatica]|uniref:Long-chain-fatty-acid CoA ligase n=1 Tax=Striga asiatica TaxID=4170 RepID=A0A5A7QHW4_STRAF|nr:long-chain-fatty-acid CoA ligase [Striga asiatica]